ncbi:hypothetical protein OPQ81_002938 [Rhizoctonia solani]|nr:hypothetical protein OPQ81_002938 [Rhizoctonia solani]
MAYLHGVEMIHGDLKACNILVSSDGVLKLTDFDLLIASDCSLLFSRDHSRWWRDSQMDGSRTLNGREPPTKK